MSPLGSLTRSVSTSRLDKRCVIRFFSTERREYSGITANRMPDCDASFSSMPVSSVASFRK